MAKMGKDKELQLMKTAYNSYSLNFPKDCRPAHYKSPIELGNKIHEYFQWCVNQQRRPLLTGMVLFLGFADVQSFTDLAERENYQYKDKVNGKEIDVEVRSDVAHSFSFIIKRARTAIASVYEAALDNPQTVTGAIFAMKQFGWSDRQDINMNHTATVRAPRLSDDEITKISDRLRKEL